MSPPLRSSLSSRRCRRLNTPALCQSLRRLQQLMPDPQPISGGRYSQGMPVLSTNRIPVKAARSPNRGRPRLLRLRLGLGNSGCTTSQSSSGTNGLAITSSVTVAERDCATAECHQEPIFVRGS